MIYVNDHLVTVEKELEAVVKQLKDYLFNEKLVIVKKDQEPMSQGEVARLLMSNEPELRLAAMHTSVLLRGFKEELESYILKVETYVEDMRETENYSEVLGDFVQVIEGLLTFSAIEKFLQKSLINQQHVNELSSKALKRAEEGNFEYVLDILEYEVLAILHHFLNETNEVM